MKLRGINPLERHVEKIFLLVMAAVFIGVIALQFVGRGNVVKLSANEEAPIDTAYRSIGESAAQRLARIRDTEVAAEARQPLPNATDEFVARLAAPMAPVARLATPLGPTRASSAGDASRPLGSGSFNVALPDVPAPSRPVAGVFGGALDPLLVAELPELAAITPQPLVQQPYDLRAVTVEATFDAAQLVASLRAEPTRADLQRIPDVWWQNIVEVLDVELTRREIVDGAPTGDQVVIPPLPGKASLRQRFDSVESLRDLQSIALVARDNAQALIRPRFYHMIAGEPWMPPSMSEQLGQQEGVIAQQRRARQSIMRQIAEEQKRLDNLGRSTGPRSSADPGARLTGVVAGIGRPGGAPSPGSRPGSQPSRADGLDQQRETLRKRIADLKTQLAAVEARLRELGVDPTGGGAAVDPAEQLLSEPIGRLRDASQLRFWAHDPTVRLGATYEYRIRVAIPNPLFGYGPNLAEAARPLSEAPVIWSEPSEWSGPVTLDDDMYVYVTQARRGADLGGTTVRASARAEVYRFFYGFWRREIAQFEPGDAVACVVDLGSLNLPVFQVAEPAPGGLPAVLGQEALSGSRAFHAPGWFVLDIIPAQVRRAGGAEHHVILRTGEGHLALRDPEADSADTRLRRLRRSFEAGQAAVVGVPIGGAEALPAARNQQTPQPRARDGEGVDPQRSPDRPPGGISGG